MNTLRRIATLVTIATMLTGSAFAADLEIPPPAPKSSATPKVMTPKLMSPSVTAPKESPGQQNQPNCSRWTDDCITCTRGANNDAPTCSNIGFACQPKAIRCISDDPPQASPTK